MALIIALLMVQIWLLSATLESYLAGENVSTAAAAVFSGMMFAICVGLYLFVRRIDAEVRRS
jgi:predicted Co/Zn/Cd cation transporter (cation efflux family)